MKGLRTLTYCPELNAITGGVTATLMLTQLEYWFDKKEGKSFFKFLAPCDHDYYREGDSWTEELAFSKAEFRHAFAQIGTVYKSKTAYQKSQDPFQGKMYLSYYDRIKKLTVYERNHKMVNKILGDRIAKETKQEVYQDTHRDIQGEAIAQVDKVITRRYSQAIDRLINKGTKDIKHTSDLQHEQDADTNCINTQSESGINKDYKQLLPHRVTTDKVVDLYHQLCPSLPKVDKLTSKHQKLVDTIRELVGDNIDQIKQVFSKIEASDFLAGRLGHSTWKSSFDWILNSSNFNKVRGGKYDVYRKEKPKAVFLRTYTHNFDLDKLEALAFQRQCANE